MNNVTTPKGMGEKRTKVNFRETVFWLDIIRLRTAITTVFLLLVQRYGLAIL